MRHLKSVNLFDHHYDPRRRTAKRGGAPRKKFAEPRPGGGSDDSAQFAAAGLDAAICYSKIAPDVPHALHMPSHIFTRLGMWQQSINSNRAAHAAAVAYVRKTLGPESFDSETVHTMDYLEYAYLQTAQDRGAKEVVDELTSFRRSAAPNLPTAYAVAAIPVRFALERRDWHAAASLLAPAIGFPLERFPWAEAMLSFARSLGAARTGDIPGAQAEIAKLQSLEDKLLEAKDFGRRTPASPAIFFRCRLDEYREKGAIITG